MNISSDNRRYWRIKTHRNLNCLCTGNDPSYAELVNGSPLMKCYCKSGCFPNHVSGWRICYRSSTSLIPVFRLTSTLYASCFGLYRTSTLSSSRIVPSGSVTIASLSGVMWYDGTTAYTGFLPNQRRAGRHRYRNTHFHKTEPQLCGVHTRASSIKTDR